MQKYIPFEKLSKKEKHRLAAANRGSWGGLNPVTRTPANSRAYQRSQAQSWKRDYSQFRCG